MDLSGYLVSKFGWVNGFRHCLPNISERFTRLGLNVTKREKIVFERIIRLLFHKYLYLFSKKKKNSIYIY